MIRLWSFDHPPVLPDPLIGCQIETLIDCYASLGIDCYQSEAGGILCRFGTSLLVSGDCEPDGFSEFCVLLGITRIEGVKGCVTPPKGWQVETHPLLQRPSQPFRAAAPPPPLAASEQMRQVFSLLCESDPRFAAEAEYLPWLSDLTRRRNRGRAQVFLLDSLATGCLSAIGGGYGWLCAVAVSPAARSGGMGSRLLSAITADCDANGLTLVTAAQDASLVSFYRRAGFSPTGRQLLIATAIPH